MENRIKNILEQNISLKTSLLSDNNFINSISSVVKEVVHCYRNNGKIMLCGNGGSAADAQHIAAELSGRFYYDRPSLPAEAIHVNTSYITAVANDYSFDEVYSRYVKGAGKKGDVFIGLSTSGSSENVVRAIQAAKEQGMVTVAITGNAGGKMKEMADININVPSNDTPRIQECHIMIGHMICELVEKEIFPS